VTHQASAEIAPLEQATTMLNGSNAISCTIPVFAGNEAAPFPGIRERKMKTLAYSELCCEDGGFAEDVVLLMYCQVCSWTS